MPLSESELILNPDGSIYHLNLHPEDIAQTIITVGDPERVKSVSKHFDSLEVAKGKREFLTHTGILGGKRITVVSTGIGTDNVDIVLNELDALVNIDFSSREVRKDKIQLDFIRIGTSGAIQPDIEVDSFLLSEHAIGLDGLLHFYQSESVQNGEMGAAFSVHLGLEGEKIRPYAVDSDKELASLLNSNRIRFGITLTNAGFYGPQSRKMRLTPKFDDFNQHLASFQYDGKKITNLEMETAGIYGLAKLLGHRAVSLNAILANRASGGFSKKPQQTIDSLITYTLEKIVQHF
ncbi:nucleoside phosphorylase [Allomuricauda sp. d1]|uniref:nucleoside phosphorylase n=1 Tax=Allomuricauda sp. d1 TaxID=3136725 RepID=UPI0031D0E2C3